MSVVAANQTTSGPSVGTMAASGDIHSLSVTVNTVSDDARWTVRVEQQSGSGEWKSLGVALSQNQDSKPKLFVAKNGLNLRSRTDIHSGTIDLKIEID